MKISREVCDGRDCFVSVRQQIGACYRPTATTTTTSITDSKHLRVVSAVGAHCPGPWEDQRRSIYNSNRPAAKHNLDHYRLGVNCERLLATSRQPRSSAGWWSSRIWLWLRTMYTIQQCMWTYLGPRSESAGLL